MYKVEAVVGAYSIVRDVSTGVEYIAVVDDQGSLVKVGFYSLVHSLI